MNSTKGIENRGFLIRPPKTGELKFDFQITIVE